MKNNMRKFDHFNLVAPHYDRFSSGNYPHLLAEYAALPTSGRLLDAAGGTGRVGFALRELAGQTVVVDLSFGMVKEARGKDSLQPACTITEELPFPDACFDRIIMVDAMHHVLDAKKTCQELWRVLIPGGRLVIKEPDIRSPMVWIVAILEKLAFMRSHFIAPAKIAAHFTHPHARSQIEIDKYTAYIIIEKIPENSL
jgi:ubiquinone/menaquinone biosynthesis C-methylase UbiE